jgi:ABC-2 type transport system permease protein
MYPAFTANAFQTRLAYRNQVWSSFFGQLIQVFARIAIWTAVYAGVASVDGITLSDMVTYSILAGVVMGAWDHALLIRELDVAIKTGDVAVFLLKPLHYPLYLFFSHCGNLAFNTLAVVLPVTLIIGVTYGIQLPASPLHGAAFLGFWALSFVIYFLLAMTCGLLAFWLMTAHSLEWFLTGIMALFSGSILPLWFFPPALAAIAQYLPFAWIAYYPTAVYLGKIEPIGVALTLAIGLGWAALLAAGVALLWSRARHRIVVQGG